MSDSTPEYRLNKDGHFPVTQQVIDDFKRNGYIIVRCVIR